MESEAIDWDQDLPLDADEAYRSLVRSLRRTDGFALLFVRCSPVQGDQIITDVRDDLPSKTIEVLELKESIDNLYDHVAALTNREQINVLFVKGIEYSIFAYEDRKMNSLYLRSHSLEYSGTWKGVPRVLGHLNLSRERFRDDFKFCFVFLLPDFALNYFIRRAPDFFDWRSNIYEFPSFQEIFNASLDSGEYYISVYNKATSNDSNSTYALSIKSSKTPDNDRDTSNIFPTINNLINDKTDYYKFNLSDASNISISMTGLSRDANIRILDKNGRFVQSSYLYGNSLSGDSNLQILDKNDRILELHEAWYILGNSLFNLDRYEDAIIAFDNVVENNPKHYEGWNNRGNSLVHVGRYEEAIASYDKAVEIKNDYYKGWNNRGVVLCNNLGRYEEAVISFDKAVESRPDYYNAWNNRAVILCDKLSRYEEAIASFDKAVQIKPDYYEAWQGRGIALSKLGRYEDAIRSYEKVVEIKPDYYDAWNNRGAVLCDKLSRYEEAIISFDKAIQIKPEDHSAWGNRGIALMNLGRYEEAISSYDKTLQIRPNDYPAWLNRGNTLYALGKYNEAIASFDQALQIKPDDPSLYYFKACVYSLQNQIELALENLQKAIQLNPEKYREMAKTDSDFDNIRHDPRFQALI